MIASVSCCIFFWGAQLRKNILLYCYWTNFQNFRFRQYKRTSLKPPKQLLGKKKKKKKIYFFKNQILPPFLSNILSVYVYCALMCIVSDIPFKAWVRWHSQVETIVIVICICNLWHVLEIHLKDHAVIFPQLKKKKSLQTLHE